MVLSRLSLTAASAVSLPGSRPSRPCMVRGASAAQARTAQRRRSWSWSATLRRSWSATLCKGLRRGSGRAGGDMPPWPLMSGFALPHRPQSRSSRQTTSSWGALRDGWDRRSSGWVGLQGRRRRQGQWPARGAEAADAVAGAFRRSAERAEWPRRATCACGRSDVLCNACEVCAHGSLDSNPCLWASPPHATHKPTGTLSTESNEPMYRTMRECL